jgi:hypothetical protein
MNTLELIIEYIELKMIAAAFRQSRDAAAGVRQLDIKPPRPPNGQLVDISMLREVLSLFVALEELRVEDPEFDWQAATQPLEPNLCPSLRTVSCNLSGVAYFAEQSSLTSLALFWIERPLVDGIVQHFYQREGLFARLECLSFYVVNNRETLSRILPAVRDQCPSLQFLRIATYLDDFLVSHLSEFCRVP